MDKREAVSSLISIAAQLAWGMNLPSCYAEDYQRHRYSAAQVAAMMLKPAESQKVMAIEIRRCVEILAGKDKGE